MTTYHDCGFQLHVEYRDDAGAPARVYTHDGRQVTECPTCGDPLPTEVMEPDPDADDDLFLRDDTGIEWPIASIPDDITDDNDPCTPALS